MWETLSRDLLAVWEKMRQVLWPKYLLGGMLQRGGGIGARREGTEGALGIGRWPDADVVLQGGMSEGLRDWDLWCVLRTPRWLELTLRGPLLFSLLLSVLASYFGRHALGVTPRPMLISQLRGRDAALIMLA